MSVTGEIEIQSIEQKGIIGFQDPIVMEIVMNEFVALLLVLGISTQVPLS